MVEQQPGGRMVDASGPDARTADGRERLVDAAERLIALRGIEGVSLREIVVAAGHRNNSAVTYHFGDRKGLFDAVWARRTSVINAERLTMLAALDAHDGSDEVRGIVEAYVVPLVSQMQRGRPSFWARFNESWFETMPLDFLDYLKGDLSRLDRPVPLSTLDQLFDRAVAVVPTGPGQATLRVSLVSRFMIAGLAAWEREVDAGRSQPQSLPAYAEQLMHLAVAMLTARV